MKAVLFGKKQTQRRLGAQCEQQQKSRRPDPEERKKKKTKHLLRTSQRARPGANFDLWRERFARRAIVRLDRRPGTKAADSLASSWPACGVEVIPTSSGPATKLTYSLSPKTQVRVATVQPKSFPYQHSNSITLRFIVS